MPVVHDSQGQPQNLLHTHRDPDPEAPTLVQVPPEATHGLPRRHAIALPKDFDQGRLGICVVEAFLLYLKYEASRNGFDPGPALSALFIYWNARKMAGTTGDPMAGTDFGTVLKAYEQFGACAESHWPQTADHVQMEPPSDLYTAAALLKLPIRYARLPEVDGPSRAHQLLRLMRWLIANDRPIMIGLDITEPIMSGLSSPSGKLPMPNVADPSKGGHGVLLGEYNDPAGVFGGQNSWGANLGLDGDFFLLYEHATLPAPRARDWHVMEVVRPGIPSQLDIAPLAAA